MTHRRYRVTVLAVVLALLVLPRAAFAEDAYGLWAIASTAVPLDTGNRWTFAFDGQSRHFDIGSGAHQILLRPSLGIRLSKTWLRLGFARLDTRNPRGFRNFENRLFFELNQPLQIRGTGSLTQRLRLLKRHVSNSDEDAWVIRWLLRYTRPLNDRHQLVLAMEPFFDLRRTDWNGSAGLSQYRVFVGDAFRVNNRWSVEAGYLLQHLYRDNRDNLANQLLSINFKRRF